MFFYTSINGVFWGRLWRAWPGQVVGQVVESLAWAPGASLSLHALLSTNNWADWLPVAAPAGTALTQHTLADTPGLLLIR